MNTHQTTTKKNPVARGIRIALLTIGGAILAAGLAVVFGYFVMLLWNWLMPELFNLTTITFWQAVGVIILARLVFGGFKHGHDHDKKQDKHPKNFAKNWIDTGKWDKDSCRKTHSHFKDFWEEEGKQAFMDYINRKDAQEQTAAGDSPEQKKE